MSQGRVIDDVRHLRDVGLERVLIGAIAVVDQRAGARSLDGGLRLGRGVRRRPRRPGHAERGDASSSIGIPLARHPILARHELRDDPAEVCRRQNCQGARRFDPRA